MIRLVLSSEEHALLEQTRRTRPQLAERCHYVFLNAQGWSVPQIARRLDHNEHTIRTWLKAYRTAGLSGVQNTPQRAAGHHRTAGLRSPRATLSPQSSHFGYIEDGWTVDLLRDYLAQHQAPASDATVRRQLKAGTGSTNASPKPCPATLPVPRKKKARVAEIVAAIGVRQGQRPVEVFFVDESHFTNEPYVQRGWCRKGHQVKVPTPTQRHSATLFGALHLRTQRFYWKRAARGTSKLFLEFLHQLHQRFPTALLILILDNATIHKSRAVKQFLTAA